MPWSLHDPGFRLVNPVGGVWTQDDSIGGVLPGRIDCRRFEAVSPIEVERDGGLAVLRYRSAIDIAPRRGWPRCSPGLGSGTTCADGWWPSSWRSSAGRSGDRACAFLSRAEIEDAFARLGSRLARRGVVADIYVIGGAAMALPYDSRRATRDIDAVFHPHGCSITRAFVSQPRPPSISWP